VTIPKIQKNYDIVSYSPEYERIGMKKVAFFYKLYLHALVTNKPYLLRNFTERRLYDRIVIFSEKLAHLKIELKYSNEQIGVDKCRLNKYSKPDDIASYISRLYEEVQVNTDFKYFILLKIEVELKYGV